MEYAIYKGDKFLFMGTEEEVLRKFGWNKQRLAWVSSSYSEKLNDNAEKGWLVAVRLNDLFTEEEKMMFDIKDNSIKSRVYRAKKKYPDKTNEEIAKILGVSVGFLQTQLRKIREEGSDI